MSFAGVKLLSPWDVAHNAFRVNKEWNSFAKSDSVWKALLRKRWPDAKGLADCFQEYQTR